MSKVVLSSYNCGENLVCNAFERRGFHNYGNYFDTKYHGVDYEFMPKSYRLSDEHIKELLVLTMKIPPNRQKTISHLMIQDRLKHLNKNSQFVLNLHIDEISSNPELYELLQNNDVVCLRRRNKFLQIIEHTYEIFKIYDGKPIVTIDPMFFTNHCMRVLRTTRLQEHFSKNNKTLDVLYENIATDSNPMILKSVTNIMDLKDIYNSFIEAHDIQWQKI